VAAIGSHVPCGTLLPVIWCTSRYILPVQVVLAASPTSHDDEVSYYELSIL